MPYVNVKVLEPLTDEQRADLVARTTDAIVQALERPAEYVYVVIDEISPERWGIGGELVSERRKRR